MTANRADIAWELCRRRSALEPAWYARHVLRVAWWHKQQEVARAILRHKRVMVISSNGIGKTHLLGGLVNWWHDTFDPGLVIATAPNAEHVKSTLFGEVRNQRRGRPGIAESSPRIYHHAKHWAKGITARNAGSVKGRHETFVLLLMDEAIDVPNPVWDAYEVMMVSPKRRWVAILNPTDKSSRAYQESRKPQRWHVINISAFDHPNVQAWLHNEPPVISSGVQGDWVNDRILTECQEVGFPNRELDIEWPPGSNKWYKPTDEIEHSILGRWPSQGSKSVWSEHAWRKCKRPKTIRPGADIWAGLDVAREGAGADQTVLHVRIGNSSIGHYAWGGKKPEQSAEMVIKILTEIVERYNLGQYYTPVGEDAENKIDRAAKVRGDYEQGYSATVVNHAQPEIGVLDTDITRTSETPTPKKFLAEFQKVLAHVNLNIDDANAGFGVTAILQHHMRVNPVNNASAPRDESKYRRARSEAWFNAAEMASDGHIDVSRLDDQSLELLEEQLLSPDWELLPSGQREVEKKEITKKKLKRSPDHADAFNLCWYAGALVVTGAEYEAAGSPYEGLTGDPLIDRLNESFHLSGLLV